MSAVAASGVEMKRRALVRVAISGIRWFNFKKCRQSVEPVVIQLAIYLRSGRRFPVGRLKPIAFPLGLAMRGLRP